MLYLGCKSAGFTSLPVSVSLYTTDAIPFSGYHLKSSVRSIKPDTSKSASAHMATSSLPRYSCIPTDVITQLFCLICSSNAAGSYTGFFGVTPELVALTSYDSVPSNGLVVMRLCLQHEHSGGLVY